MFPASSNRPVFAGVVSAIRNLFCLLPIEAFIVLTASESSVLVAVVNIGAFVFIVVFNAETVTEAWHSAREHHELMLQYYREQNWDKAISLCQELTGSFDGNMDHYYEKWIERIADMRTRDLPENWDGTYRATSK